MVQVYTNKTAAIFKANESFVYSAYLERSNFSWSIHRFLLDQKQPFVEHSPVCTTTNEQYERKGMLENAYENERSVFHIYDALSVIIQHPKNAKRQELHEAMQNIIQHLFETMLSWFMVHVCGMTWKSHPDFISYFSKYLWGMDITGLNYPNTMYVCIQHLTWKRDICELKVEPAQIAHEIRKLFKSYKHPYSANAELLEKKQRKARSKPNECVSILDLYSLNRNDGASSPLGLTNSNSCNDRFTIYKVNLYTFFI